MQIETIETTQLGRAEAVLARGFPNRPPGFWRRALSTLDDYRRRHQSQPIGTLLVHEGKDVGVLLSIESRTAGGGRKVNLSSWYVDAEARFFAPLMLRAALARAPVATDLSPTGDVRAVNERLGMGGRVLGSMIVPLPIDALRPSQGKVREGTAGASGADDVLLADHAAMGLVTATLGEATGTVHPLIFMPTTLRGVPGARLIYCRSLSTVGRERGAIARFLLARGYLFLEIEANRADTWPGAIHAPSRCVVFAKGELPVDAIDHSYTELPFIHCTSRSQTS